MTHSVALPRVNGSNKCFLPPLRMAPAREAVPAGETPRRDVTAVTRRLGAISSETAALSRTPPAGQKCPRFAGRMRILAVKMYTNKHTEMQVSLRRGGGGVKGQE